MAEAGENRVSDFLKSFSSSVESDSITEGVEQAEVELTLGLSLNGRFGVDPSPRGPKLARSSSIPEYMNPSAPVDYAAAMRQVLPAVGNGNLMRTNSLPVEPEEEVRKRKEMQSMRRMEAKRKRIEKQRNSSSRADRECGDRRRVVPIPVMKLEKRVPPAKVGMCSEKLRLQGGGQVVVSSQGSAFESETQVIQVMSNKGAEVRCMEQNGQMEAETNGEVAPVRTTSLGTRMKNQFNKLTVSDNNNGTKESLVSNVMRDMPCVSTQGDGPDGKRIEGLLYRYSQSEEVRIVCVCHGKFMSPSEFVKHAGRTDVGHPLKHIVVTPSAFL